MTHTCDKCSHEEVTESKVNQHIQVKPNDWSMPEIKTGQYLSIRILLCPQCAKKAGFSSHSEPVGNHEDKQSSAEKLIDILFELAEERGVFNGE